MAILTKASTVRNRTAKVNKFELYLTHIASLIDDTSAQGDYEVEVYVPPQFKDQLFAELAAAGYDTKFSYYDVWPCQP